MKITARFRDEQGQGIAKHALNTVNQIRIFNKMPLMNEKDFYGELIVERAIQLLEEIDKKREEERLRKQSESKSNKEKITGALIEEPNSEKKKETVSRNIKSDTKKSKQGRDVSSGGLSSGAKDTDMVSSD